MPQKEGKLSRAVELPICPFCDSKVYYTSWITHKIFQMECETCGAHWHTGLDKTNDNEFFVELTKSSSEGYGRELLNQKLPLDYWKDMIIERIKI